MGPVSRAWVVLCAVLALGAAGLAGAVFVREDGARAAWIAHCRSLGGHVVDDVPTTANPLVADGAVLTDECVDDNGFVLNGYR